MVNAYPFFAYSANSDTISLDYALFRNNSGVVDSGNGLRYHSLLEAQLDAVFTAMSALNYNDVKMVVTETGWPSMGDENEIGAGEENAASYNGNLVRRVLTRGGTPLRPQHPPERLPIRSVQREQETGAHIRAELRVILPERAKGV
ncbi:hypothetical protein SLA2020_355100 [Shorea laevis]